MTSVPWVALWTAEREALRPAKVVWTDPPTILDPEPDEYGVRFREYPDDLQGHGEPIFAHVHTRRQVKAMGEGFCQVCGVQMFQWDVTWVLDEVSQMLFDLGGPYYVQTPPTCRKCIKIAVDVCPHLIGLKSTGRLRVIRAQDWGIALWNAEIPRPDGSWDDMILPVDDPRLEFAIVRQAIGLIRKWEPVGNP
jgi:hypothetical protein